MPSTGFTQYRDPSLGSGKYGALRDGTHHKTVIFYHSTGYPHQWSYTTSEHKLTTTVTPAIPTITTIITPYHHHHHYTNHHHHQNYSPKSPSISFTVWEDQQSDKDQKESTPTLSNHHGELVTQDLQQIHSNPSHHISLTQKSKTLWHTYSIFVKIGRGVGAVAMDYS